MRLFAHPNPLLYRLTQYAASTLMVLMIISAPLQISLTVFMGAPGGIFVLTALITLLLTLPVMMVTTATPPVRISDEGIWLEPLIWRNHFISWASIQTIKPYPLLPTEAQETQRRAFVGRKNYQPAQGIMLIVSGLPVHYRVTAFFAGEGSQSVIALTNRSHCNYLELKEIVQQHVEKQTTANTDDEALSW